VNSYPIIWFVYLIPDLCDVLAGLFSAVGSALTTKLELHCLRAIPHLHYEQLPLDTDTASITWTCSSPGIITARPLSYINLVTFLLAAFLAMLGKQ